MVEIELISSTSADTERTTSSAIWTFEMLVVAVMASVSIVVVVVVSVNPSDETVVTARVSPEKAIKVLLPSL